MTMDQVGTRDCIAESPAGHVLSGSIHGILVVDKPEGLTSFQMVKRVTKAFSLAKAGHCGTLDPFATGVLLVAVNHGARIVDQLTLHDKEYVCTVRFGIETDTLDRTGQPQESYDGPALAVRVCEDAAKRFVGTYEQEVPKFSAVHVGGRRLHELARRGIDVPLPKRNVTIESIELLSFDWPLATLRVRCSKGTYIRQLGADIGREMGCGAHLQTLRRTASGPFGEDRALSFNEIEDLRSSGLWAERVVSLSEALTHLPMAFMEDEGLLRRLRNGDLDRSWESDQMASLPEGQSPVRILTSRMQLAALWWPDAADGSGRRLRVFSF
jgi:tRNA pseudouridine55 synthase